MSIENQCQLITVYMMMSKKLNWFVTREALRFIELIEASLSSELDGRYTRLHPEDTMGQCYTM